MQDLDKNGFRGRSDTKDGRGQSATSDKQMAKHTLLATAANQNYQRCFRALQSLETYWAGVKYILTVLSQKAQGVGDPLLYTREEMECALEVPRPEPSFDTPGWRRKLSWGAYVGPQNSSEKDQGPVAALKSSRGPNFGIPGSPMADPNSGKVLTVSDCPKMTTNGKNRAAIGWSLTGTMNSPSTSLAVLYPTDSREGGARRPQDGGMNASISSVMAQGQTSPQQQRSHMLAQQQQPLPRYPNNTQIFAQPNAATAPSSMQPPPPPTNAYMSDPALVSDADLLLSLHSPYSTASSPAGGRAALPTASSAAAVNEGPYPSQGSHTLSAVAAGMPHAGAAGPIPFSDMFVESTDIDINSLNESMVPWLEWLPTDMAFYDPSTGTATAADGSVHGQGPPGAGQGED